MRNQLRTKIALGAVWTVLMRTSLRLLGIISLIFLARLLTPEDFGIVAKATLIYGFLETISGFGFQSALIKNQNASIRDYNTVWTISLYRGLAIGLVLIFTSPLLAFFLKEPALTPIIICYGLISIFNGLTNVGIVDFLKEMNFHLDFRFNLIKKLSGFIVTLLLAYLYKSYWALVLGALASNIVAFILSYLMCSYRPKLDISKWHELFHFSKWVFGYDLFAALSTKLDLFILSRYSSSDVLGLYTVSYEIAGTPSSELSMPIARATLPGLSKINNNPSEYQQTYLEILGMVIFIALPSSLGLSAISGLIVPVFLGDGWHKASTLISILAFAGFFRAINAIGVSAYISNNRPDTLTKVTAFSLVLRLIGIPIGMYFWGVIGICWSIVVTSAIVSSQHLLIQNKLGMLSLKRLSQALLRVILSSGIMFTTLHLFPTSKNLSDPLALCLSLFIGITIFIISLFCMRTIMPYPTGPDCIAIKFLVSKFKDK